MVSGTARELCGSTLGEESAEEEKAHTSPAHFERDDIPSRQLRLLGPKEQGNLIRSEGSSIQDASIHRPKGVDAVRKPQQWD